MKRGRIATILGVAILLAIALPLHAEGPVNPPIEIMPWFYDGSDILTGFCDCPSSAETNCYCDYPALEAPSECTIESVLNAYRSLDSYHSEDVENLYFTASITDTPQTNTYSADASGQNMMALSKSFLQDWVNNGCPE